MMTSLMSIFDPSMVIGTFSGWSVVLLSIVLSMSFWYSPSSVIKVKKVLVGTLAGLFKMNSLVFVSIFFFVLNMNMAGLLPLVFSPTSHLSFNLILALTLWSGMMLWYLKGNFNQFLTHLTPVGCPLALAPALVVIELVSSLIRPLTLSLRLMANVMAGHMILTLISKGVLYMPGMVSVMLFSVLAGFLMFEFGVAVVQSYVFSSLMSLYWEESESSH